MSLVCGLEIRRGGLCSSLLWLALLAVPHTCFADIITLTTSQGMFTPGVKNQGNWKEPGTPGNLVNSSQFYATGRQVGGGAGPFLRSFFTFDLSGLGPNVRVLGGELQLTRFSSFGVPPTVQLGLFDVSTDASVVNFNNGPGNQAVFDDLGSGRRYGAYSVAGTGPTDEVLQFTLNGAAIEDMLAARGGYFSIGMSMLGPDTLDTRGLMFTQSGSGGIQALVLNVSTVPEPTVFPVLIISALCVLRRRR